MTITETVIGLALGGFQMWLGGTIWFKVHYGYWENDDPIWDKENMGALSFICGACVYGLLVAMWWPFL